MPIAPLSPRRTRLRTKALRLAEQTYPPVVAPLPGETVGVGIPVIIVTFDVPVTGKANVQKHMHVTSTPAQPGNVSHGCTGMSTANADWLYHMSVRGDVLETTGTGRPMELGDGYGDWKLSYANHTTGSALS